MKLPSFGAAAMLAIISTVSPADAITLSVNSAGQLTGATGVDVGGSLYDVSFQDGTCLAIFNASDDVSDFTFQTFSDASAASLALLNQVFLDVPLGNFDSTPELTEGCSDDLLCFVVTPYGPLLDEFFVAVHAVNVSATSGFSDEISGANRRRSTNFSNTSATTFAVWTPSAATIPLPAGGWLLISGLAVIGALRRRQKVAA